MSPPTREEAIATVQAGYAASQRLFGQLDDAAMVRPATIGGGDWSAKDLMGHLAFWEELATESLAAWRAGRRPPTDADDGSWPGTDLANAHDQERTQRQLLPEIRQRSATAHATVIDAMRSMSADEWSARPFYVGARNPTLGDLLGGVLGGAGGPFRHVEDHLPDLERYVYL